MRDPLQVAQVTSRDSVPEWTKRGIPCRLAVRDGTAVIRLERMAPAKFEVRYSLCLTATGLPRVVDDVCVTSSTQSCCKAGTPARRDSRSTDAGPQDSSSPRAPAHSGGRALQRVAWRATRPAKSPVARIQAERSLGLVRAGSLAACAEPAGHLISGVELLKDRGRDLSESPRL